MYYYFSFPIVTFRIWLALVFYGLEQTCITIIRLLLDVMSVLQTKSHSTSLERGPELVKVTPSDTNHQHPAMSAHNSQTHAPHPDTRVFILSSSPESDEGMLKGPLVLASIMSSGTESSIDLLHWLTRPCCAQNQALLTCGNLNIKGHHQAWSSFPIDFHTRNPM